MQWRLAWKRWIKGVVPRRTRGFSTLWESSCHAWMVPCIFPLVLWAFVTAIYIKRRTVHSIDSQLIDYYTLLSTDYATGGSSFRGTQAPHAHPEHGFLTFSLVRRACNLDISTESGLIDEDCIKPLIWARADDTNEGARLPSSDKVANILIVSNSSKFWKRRYNLKRVFCVE
jgi:hypothetical protein